MMVCTYRQCLPEIAASAYGLLAMTNLRAVRHKINTANIADLHGAQGKPQRACFRRFPFHVKGRPLRMSSDIIPAALSGFIIKAGFSKKGRLQLPVGLRLRRLIAAKSIYQYSLFSFFLS